MTITYTHNGYWQITDIVGGCLKTRTYLDYEQREAAEAFAAEFGLDLTEELLPCQTCAIGVPADTWLEELEFCVECQHAYFTHEEN